MSNKEEAKKAAIAYSKILRHIGEQLETVNAESLSDESRDTMPYTILELADAFAEKAGFMFSKRASLTLSLYIRDCEPSLPKYGTYGQKVRPNRNCYHI